MSDFQIQELIGWVREGGEIAQRFFHNVTGHRKADQSWVTEADVAIERTLVERIAARYPDHGIIGEEQTREALDREFVWALDPLDGTTVFLDGLPLWGVSLGLLRYGQPYLGVIYLPLLNDCYWVLPGGSAHVNDQPIHVAEPREWTSDDWLATPSNVHRRYAIDFIGKTRTIGATVGTFCYVACGSAIGGLFNKVGIWDVAAGLAILHAAGGVARGLSGAELDTTAMLSGDTFRETVVIGAPAHAQGLARVIHPRG